MNKKYKLTNNTIEYNGKTLYQIQALKDFANVKTGDFGGYIEKESNLSHEGNCWVYGNAKVSGDAKVFGYARVSGDARVFGNAKLYGDAEVSGDAKVSGYARVSGDARVSGNAWVYGNAKVFGDAWVYGNAKVSGDAKVFGYARVFGYAKVSGDAWVYGNAKVYGDAEVSGDAKVSGNAWVSGDARVSGTSIIKGITYISSNFYAYFENVEKENVAIFDNNEYPLKEYDGIKCFVVKESIRNGIGIVEAISLSREYIFIAIKDELSAHGNTREEAKEELNFKIEAMIPNAERIKTIKEKGSISCLDYRYLTGACEYGVNEFCKRNGIKDTTKEIKLSKLKELLKPSDYGYDKAQQLFKEGE